MLNTGDTFRIKTDCWPANTLGCDTGVIEGGPNDDGYYAVMLDNYEATAVTEWEIEPMGSMA